jgi:hypothetical protein
MLKSLAMLSIFACLPLAAQDSAAQKKFAGTWEAKFKDQVICTIRVKAGDPITGETSACSINVDENGDLKEPEGDASSDISPMVNPVIHGDILSFEDKDGNEVLKFELKLTGDGRAELTILESPVPLKPIHFSRK